MILKFGICYCRYFVIEMSLEWARSVDYRYGFVVVILRLDTWTGQRERMTYVLLGC